MKLPSISIRGGAAAMLSALLAATALASMAPSQALNSTLVGPRDSTRAGFPAYYTDDAGVALQLCVDGTAKCLNTALTDVTTPPEGEGFYWLATTSLAGAGFEVDIEFAAEAAWLNRRTPITFDRFRIRGHSDAAGDIDVTTPWGDVFTVTAEDPFDADGRPVLRNVNFTEDLGCAVAPCDFKAMAVNGHIGAWLRSTTPPAGYLGDSVTSEPATVGAGGPAATITVAKGADTATTADWVVMGKLAAVNRVSLPNTLNFGNTARVSTRSVTMKNLGTTARTISSVTLAGSKNFKKLASSTCKGGTVLAVGKSCKVDLSFKPGAKPSTATLTITDDKAARKVTLKGR